MRHWPLFRLRLTSLWPALVALAVATLLLGWWLLPSLTRENAGHQLLSSLELLAPVVAEHTDLAGPELQAWVRSVVPSDRLRLTLIAEDGRVVADSSRTYSEMLAMDNHGHRPEVMQARQQGNGVAVRHSATTDHDYVYAARPLITPDGRHFTLRLAQPRELLTPVRRRLLGTFALAAVVGLVAMGVTSWRLDRRFFSPLSQLLQAAEEMAAGGFGRRLQPPAQGDLARLAAALNRLSGRVEEQLATLEAERDHLQRILSSMQEGVLVTDQRRRARLTNPSFRRLFRLPDAATGRLPPEISRYPQLAQVIEEVFAGDASPEHTLETADGRIIALSGSSLSGSGGAVVVARDITEEQRLGQMRRDFVANVSHELKTPLSAIRGYAETLRDHALEDRPAAERFLDRILAQCQSLQALLEDLLTLSRLEGLEFAPDPEPVDLVQLTRDTVEVVAGAARERGVELVLDTPPVPPLRRGSYNDLERLLLNLLQNAIKYNQPGGRVTLRLRPAGDDVVIEVEDTGIGIPLEAQPRIFERFYRVDKGRSRGEGGTGLGLSIVKHVAQAHGGSVDLTSILGQGSTFRVRLPSA